VFKERDGSAVLTVIKLGTVGFVYDAEMKKEVGVVGGLPEIGETLSLNDWFLAVGASGDDAGFHYGPCLGSEKSCPTGQLRLIAIFRWANLTATKSCKMFTRRIKAKRDFFVK
jgi:hypothetical protein